MKTLLLVAGALAAAAPAQADLMCDLHELFDDGGLACPAPRTPAATGDDARFFQRALDAAPGLAQALLDELDADVDALRAPGTTFANDLANPAGLLRRFVNAGILLDQLTGPDAEPWIEWVTDWSACVWFMAHCGDSGGLRGESSGIGSIGLTPIAMTFLNPIERASVLVHEAGHFFEAHISDDDCPAHASCDLSLDDDGPQANQIDFLMDAKAQLDDLPDPAWAEVRVGINSKLNQNFERHPGFNLARPNSVYRGAYRTVGFDVREGYTQATLFPDPDAAPLAITGLGLAVQDDVVVRLQVRRRAAAVDGTLIGVPTTQNVGLETGAPLQRSVDLPDGYVATGLKLRATADGVTHLGLVGRRLIAQPGAVLTGEITVWASGLSTAAPETSFVVGSGELLTGLGLRMRDGNLDIHAYKSELPRGFTATAGGSGGQPSATFCSTGTRIIGVTTGVEGAGADQSVGFFGLICARDADIDAGMAPAQAARTLLFTGYFDEDTGQLRSGGVASYATIAAQGPADKRVDFCPAGAAVERVAVYHDHLVRKVAWFSCTDGSVVSVNAGRGVGSYTHLACDADPVTGAARPLVVNGLRARSGWRLDALTLHCTPD